MKKYKFIKDYSQTVTVGGAVGLSKKYWKIGDIVEGTKKTDGIEIRIAPHSEFNNTPSNMSYQELVIIPIEYLEEQKETTTAKVLKYAIPIAIGIGVIILIVWAWKKFGK